MRVQFSLGVKLVSIISVLMVVSLGGMTIIATVMINKDVQITAEDTNYSINRRTALSADYRIKGVYDDALLLLNHLTALNHIHLLEQKKDQAVDYFYQQNQAIGAIGVSHTIRQGAGESEMFINRYFMVANRLTASRIEDFLQTQVEAISLAREGRVFLLNVSPFFEMELLELLFPWKNGDIDTTVMVFFSIDSLKETFSDRVNRSFIVNESGDLLIDPESERVRAGVNLRNQAFIKQILEGTGQNLQTAFLDETGNRNFVAYQRLSLGNAFVVTVIPAKTVFQGIVATTWRNIFVSLGVLLGSIFCILLFARRSLRKPLKALTEAAGMIEEGTYQIDRTITFAARKDEIGILATSFISMSRGLISFEKFTNKTLTNLARSGKLVLGGTERKATMFFSDIRGFTAISEKLQAHEIVEFLNEYMERMVACVRASGGIVDKFIGDAVMAHWGAVESSGSPQQDALHCVKSALMMRASLMAFNQGRGGVKKPIIKIGCGVNSGNLVAGQIGSNERLEYTVIGDTVSFADRTETFNKPFGTEILISENTWKLCGKYLITEEMPQVTEKGKKVRMFAVVNMADPDETEDLLRCLDGIPKNIPKITRRCVGPEGPQTLAEVRSLLGIATPDLSKVNTDEEEKKYTISTEPPK
ncbi:adenylate cyclase [Hollandina sp. SP2]